MKIAVTSPSFSKHPELISEMENSFENVKLNSEGLRFSKDELIEYLTGYDAAIVGLDKIDKDVIDALPGLKMIAKYGVGLDNIDLEYCKEKGVAIGWSGGVNRTSVAEMVIGNAISLLRNLYVSSNQLSNGDWIKNGGEQLTGKTVGIIGVGFIGKELVRLLKPFNCRILVNDIIDQTEYYKENDLIESDKETIFKEADVISFHTPLVDETRSLVNTSTLNSMKSTAIVINTARGGIINEDNLKTALINGAIRGAAIDVYDVEPPEDSELLSLPNLINTPHIGGNAREAVYAMGMSAIGHLKNIYNK